MSDDARNFDYEELEQILDLYFSPPQREWFARLMHDHISNAVGNISMQVEIINKMIARDMDISEELESLKDHISASSKHIVEIERVMRPGRDDDEADF